MVVVVAGAEAPEYCEREPGTRREASPREVIRGELMPLLVPMVAAAVVVVVGVAEVGIVAVPFPFRRRCWVCWELPDPSSADFGEAERGPLLLPLLKRVAVVEDGDEELSTEDTSLGSIAANKGGHSTASRRSISYGIS